MAAVVVAAAVLDEIEEETGARAPKAPCGSHQRDVGTDNAASSLTCIWERTPSIGIYAIDDDFDEGEYTNPLPRARNQKTTAKMCVAAVRIVESDSKAQVSSLPM